MLKFLFNSVRKFNKIFCKKKAFLSSLFWLKKIFQARSLLIELIVTLFRIFQTFTSRRSKKELFHELQKNLLSKNGPTTCREKNCNEYCERALEQSANGHCSDICSEPTYCRVNQIWGLNK